jgi:hypothetical protein
LDCGDDAVLLWVGVVVGGCRLGLRMRLGGTPVAVILNAFTLTIKQGADCRSSASLLQ